MLYFLDIAFDYSFRLYDFFMSFLAYTYACAGISYLSNLLLIIMVDMGKHRFLYSDQRLRKMRAWLHVIVGLLDFAIILYFFASFFVSSGEVESDHKSVAILYYFGAALVCIVNLLQWVHIKYRVKSVQFHKTKLMAIFAILLVSYLLRGILNSAGVVTQLNQLNCKNFPYNWGHCAFLIFFYGIELFIPLQLLFYFQFCKNKATAINQSMIDSQITDPLATMPHETPF